MLDVFEYGEESVCVPFTSFEGKVLTRKYAIRRGWQRIDAVSSESKRCFMTARSVLAQDPVEMRMRTVDEEANGGRMQLSQGYSENELIQRLPMSHRTQKEGANKVRMH